MMKNAETISSSILETRDLSVIYADGHQGVKHVSLIFQERHVTAIIGPSGCGKSTLCERSIE